MRNKLKVFISGQKYFGSEVLRLCLRLDFIEVVGVCCPLEDKYIGGLAKVHNIPIVPSGSLCYDTMPENVDLGITAHSFDYIGKRTRYKTKFGWIGYHPSLLPRHRGKSSIEWAIRMREPITGGTVFWLNAGIDRGDIAAQEFCFVRPSLFSMKYKDAAKKLWESELQDMGVRLLEKVLDDVSNGEIVRVKQDEELSTFEPCTDVKDVYKPDLLMIPYIV